MSDSPKPDPEIGRYDPDTGRYEARFEHYDEAPYAVVRAVAAASSIDPTALQPIIDLVDPDTLIDILEPPTETAAHANLTVSFTYNGCQVIVTRTGLIEVDPPDDGAETNAG